MNKPISDRLTQYHNAIENKTGIKTDIIGVGAVGLFSVGWINYDFMYEKPRILLDLDTEVGSFQLDIGLDKLDDNLILSLFEDNGYDIRNLVGETIYIAPNEQFEQASISDSTEISFCQDDSHILQSGDNRRDIQELEINTQMNRAGVQKMPLIRMNHILRTEIQRRFDGEHGWMKTEVELQEDKDEVRFISDIQDGVNTVSWSFNNTVSSYENIKEFLDSLNLGFILAEGSGEVWVKPLRSIHFSNRPSDSNLISDSQTWVISSHPMMPEKNPSILERIREFFSTSDNISVSIDYERSTKSKIADFYKMYEGSCYYEDSKSSTARMEEMNV